MDLDECICARKSTRWFNNQPIPDDVVRTVIESGMRAPSPKNRQPWSFIVLKGRAKKAVCDACLEVLSTMDKEALLAGEYPSGRGTIRAISMAPILILVFNRFPSEQGAELRFGGPDISNIQAIGAAIQNMLLKATSMGLSSLWACDILTAREFIESKYCRCGRLIAGVLLGYADEEANEHIAPASRLPFDELVRWDA